MGTPSSYHGPTACKALESVKDIEDALELGTLANRMQGKGLIDSKVYRDVYLDNKANKTESERKEILLTKLRQSVKKNGSVFGWFLQFLNEDIDTLLSSSIANELVAKYQELSSGIVEESIPTTGQNKSQPQGGTEDTDSGGTDTGAGEPILQGGGTEGTNSGAPLDTPKPPDAPAVDIKKPKNLPYDHKLVKDINVILMTAVDVELETVLSKTQPLKGQEKVIKVIIPSSDVSIYLGMYGVHKVAVVKSGKGIIKARQTLTKVREVVKAKYVISIGICYGLKKDKLKLGDIIVSSEIYYVHYEQKGSPEESSFRKDCQQKPGARLCSILEVSLGFQLENVEVHFRPIVSEEVRNNNLEYWNKVKEDSPDAYGAEMEGGGIMEVAEDQGLQAIVVKAISDWGDGTKTKGWQRFATHAAAEYVLFHLKEANLDNKKEANSTYRSYFIGFIVLACIFAFLAFMIRLLL